MATNDIDMAQKVISFGGYDESELEIEGAEQAVSMAKDHLNLETKLPPEDRNWYENKYQEEALLWTSLLFSKIQAEQLDSKAVSVGAVEESELLAKDDDTLTEWYRKYRRERNRLRARFSNPDYQRRSSRTADDDGSRQYSRQ